jgi:quinohemoprotein ethanol dehydrogenase
LAFKLGGAAKLPEVPAAVPLTPLPSIGDAETIAKGFALFHTFCSVCHGDSSVGGGVITDLRWSAVPADSAAFKAVVLEGTFKDRGMVSFAKVLSEADAEAVRAYISMRSNQSYAEMNPASAASPAAPDAKTN